MFFIGVIVCTSCCFVTGVIYILVVKRNICTEVKVCQYERERRDETDRETERDRDRQTDR